MKKTVSVFLVFMITVLLLLPAFAGTGTDILTEHNKEYLDECNDVRLAVQAGAGGSFSEAVDFELMYRCYKLSNENFVKAYKNAECFMDNISSSYSWIVPRCTSDSGNGGELIVVESNDIEFGWIIREGINYPAGENFISPDYVSICERILKSHPEADMSTICAVESVNLDCRLFCFLDNGEEYLLPIFLSEDPEWASSGEIYEAKEFVEKAEDSFPAPPEQSNGFFKNMKDNLDYIIIATVVILIILIATGFYIKKTKRTEDE